MRSELERFVSKLSFDGCWLWTGAVSRDGYGQFAVNRRPVLAHRWAYQFWNGPIPTKHEIDHLCRNPQCVNPSHLEAVTHRENVLRGARGRLVTHCPKGHVYDEKNTYVDTRGLRNCRTCGRASVAAYRHRKLGRQLP